MSKRIKNFIVWLNPLNRKVSVDKFDKEILNLKVVDMVNQREYQRAVESLMEQKVADKVNQDRINDLIIAENKQLRKDVGILKSRLTKHQNTAEHDVGDIREFVKNKLEHNNKNVRFYVENKLNEIDFVKQAKELQVKVDVANRDLTKIIQTIEKMLASFNQAIHIQGQAAVSKLNDIVEQYKSGVMDDAARERDTPKVKE